MYKHPIQFFCEKFKFKVQSYCGRGMRKECLGILVDSLQEFIGRLFFFAAINKEEKIDLLFTDIVEIEDALKSFRQDNLGKQIIIYFPSIPFVENSDENEGEND